MTTTSKQVIAELEMRALQLATPDQRAQMPEEELVVQLARDELFRPFAMFRRWFNTKNLRPSDARHQPGCQALGFDLDALDRHITFDTTPEATLTRKQTDILKALHATASSASDHPWCQKTGATFVLEVRTHRATCRLCRESVKAASVLVSVPWAGRVLTREYAL